MYLRYDIATDQELARYGARSNLNRGVLYELHGGHSVIRVSSDVVIKCGFGVTQEEVTSQIRAYDLIDQIIIRVPRVSTPVLLIQGHWTYYDGIHRWKTSKLYGRSHSM